MSRLPHDHCEILREQIADKTARRGFLLDRMRPMKDRLELMYDLLTAFSRPIGAEEYIALTKEKIHLIEKLRRPQHELDGVERQLRELQNDFDLSLCH